MNAALTITGFDRIVHFRRACHFYSERWPEYDLYLVCNHDASQTEIANLAKMYPNTKAFFTTGTNLGFHPGAIGIIGKGLDLANEHQPPYDAVVCIHCDILLTDKTIVEEVLFSDTFKGKLLAGSRLIWGNLGICTEYLLVNMNKARELKALPMENYGLPPHSMEAEAAMEKWVDSFGPQYFLDLLAGNRRPSYGYFPEIGMIHMHPWQTSNGNEVLDTLGLQKYYITNYEVATV